MKKWMFALLCLGYIIPSWATDHSSFLVTGGDLREISYYDNILETPSFFTTVYPQRLNPNLVLIPRTNSGFEFGVVGFYQRPFDNQLDYSITELNPPPFFLVSPNSPINAVDPGHDLGAGAYIGYIFPYTGRDIRLDVSTFSSSERDSVGAIGSGTIWTPLALYDLSTISTGASSHYSISMDQAKLMVGQQLFGGARFHLRPSLGGKFATINRRLSTHYPSASAPPILPLISMNTNVYQKSFFSGGGPAVQIDGAYFFTPGFGLAGHITSALLAGNIKSEIRYTDDRFPPPDSTQIRLPSTNRTVPNVDGQLALVFRHLFCGTHTTLDIELGYDFNHFFNAVDTYRSTSLSVFELPVSLPFTATHVKHVHDLTLEGPYLSIGVSGISCPTDVVIDPVLVTIPRLPGGFIFGLGAGYFITQHNQLDYALLDSTAISLSEGNGPLPSLGTTLKSIKPTNAYGGMLSAGYIFGGTPYDAQIHYRGSVTNDHESTFAPATGVIWTILSTPIFDPALTRSFATEARAKVRFNYHDANLELGQTITADSLIWLRLFGGLQYASIRDNLHTTYSNVATTFLGSGLTILPQENIVQTSRFNGVGPRLGFDIAMPIGGFALTSELAGGILLGSLDTTYRDEFPSTIAVETGTPLGGGVLGVRSDSDAAASPYLNLKVGLAYTFNFFAQSRWVLDLGYMAIHYFNAAANFRHVTNNSGAFVKQIQDVTLNGPYLNLTVYGFGTCAPDCIIREPYTAFAPILKGGFEFAIEGLYLQPHAMNTNYVMADPSPVFIVGETDIFPFSPSSTSSMQEVKPRYEFGSRFHLGYIFPQSANDISANYASLKGNNTKTTNAGAGGFLWTLTNGNFATGIFSESLPDIPFIPFPVIANRATATVDFTWQTGNIEFGRRLKFYQLMTRFWGGLSYARVIEDIDITYNDGFTLTSPFSPFLPVAISSDTLSQHSSYFGIGPRLGIAGDLAFGCGLSLIGQVGSNLLVGKIKSRLIESSSAGVSTGLKPGQRTRLVPALDAKLAFAFTVPFRDCSQFGIEAGYEFNHYFNVKDSLRYTDNFSTFLKQDQDISFDGPYLRLQLNI